MAERIVSPGVFTREKDLSFLPQGISEIGAAIIGPTQKGPAFTPTQVSNFSEFEEIFGSLDSRFYVPYTAKQYLKSAGTVTIVRVLGIGGYEDTAWVLKTTGSLAGVGGHMAAEGYPEYFGKTLAILASTRLGGGTHLNIRGYKSIAQGRAPLTSSLLEVSASGGNMDKEISFNTGSESYIDKLIPSDPQNNTVPVYLYKNFKSLHGDMTGKISGSFVTASTDGTGLNHKDGSTGFDSAGTASVWEGNVNYEYARTPYLQSQNIGGSRYSLFRVYTRAQGSNINNELKVNILNVKDAGSVAGSDYGTFSLQVRSVNFNNDRLRPTNDAVIEQWDNLSFDPNE